MGRCSMRTDNFRKKPKRRNQMTLDQFSTWPMRAMVLFWKALILLGIIGMLVTGICSVIFGPWPI